MGFSSIAEYVREAVRDRLRKDEIYVDELDDRKKRENESLGV